MDDDHNRRFWRGENGTTDWMQFLLSFLIMLRTFTADTPAFLMLAPATQESFRDFAAFIQIIAYLRMTEMFGAARCINQDPTELLRILRSGSRGTPSERPEAGAESRQRGNESAATASGQKKEWSDSRQKRHGGPAPSMQGFGGVGGVPGVGLNQTAGRRVALGGAREQRTYGGTKVGEKRGWRCERRNGNLCNVCGSYLHRTEVCPFPFGTACTHAKRRLWNRTHRGQSARFNPYPIDRELQCSLCNAFGHCILTCDVFEQRTQIWCHRCGRYGSHLPSNCPGNTK